MLTISGSTQRLCDGLPRREFLKVGAPGVAGLTLADLLRLRASAAPGSTRHKAIIMVYLDGWPSHVDMYDLKPDAPVEYRGEFRPIRTNVPGLDICELLPRQAQIADKLAIIRNMQFRQQGHTSPELYTGFLGTNRLGGQQAAQQRRHRRRRAGHRSHHHASRPSRPADLFAG
jgi:hypothetical protein